MQRCRPGRKRLCRRGVFTRHGRRRHLALFNRKQRFAGQAIEQKHEAEFGRGDHRRGLAVMQIRSEEHTSELQSLMRISYAVFCLKKKKTKTYIQYTACTDM